jgi:anti-sigma B factor antagonist
MDISEAIKAFSAKNPGAGMTIREDPIGPIVVLSGSLELQSSYELQGILSLIVETVEPGKRLAIDMSAVAYISSTGVGALTSTLIGARKRNIGIVFIHVPPKVLSLLELLGLASFFPLEDGDA